MSKKPKKLKLVPKKGKAAKKPAAKGPSKRTKARGVEQRLPEMEIEKDRILSNYCKTIKEALNDQDEVRATLESARANSMARMANKGQHQYTDHGVTLIYVKGEDKLTVKRVKSDAGGEDPGDYVPGTDSKAGDVLESPANAGDMERG